MSRARKRGDTTLEAQGIDRDDLAVGHAHHVHAAAFPARDQALEDGGDRSAPHVHSGNRFYPVARRTREVLPLERQ